MYVYSTRLKKTHTYQVVVLLAKSILHGLHWSLDDLALSVSSLRLQTMQGDKFDATVRRFRVPLCISFFSDASVFCRERVLLLFSAMRKGERLEKQKKRLA